MSSSSDFSKITDEGLQNLLDNYRRAKKMTEPYYREVLAELARRKGKGLDFATSIDVIGRAAKAGRFISYGEVAQASGAQWNRVRRAIGPHLDELLEYCHLNGLPHITAIVVNQQNLNTGELEPDLLKGFITGVRRLGVPVTDEKTFLREAQQQVFDWGKQRGHED